MDHKLKLIMKGNTGDGIPFKSLKDAYDVYLNITKDTKQMVYSTFCDQFRYIKTKNKPFQFTASNGETFHIVEYSNIKSKPTPTKQGQNHQRHLDISKGKIPTNEIKTCVSCGIPMGDIEQSKCEVCVAIEDRIVEKSHNLLKMTVKLTNSEGELNVLSSHHENLDEAMSSLTKLIGVIDWKMESNGEIIRRMKKEEKQPGNKEKRSIPRSLREVEEMLS